MKFDRRAFLALLATTTAQAQGPRIPVNADEHGMKVSGMDGASEHMMAARAKVVAPAASPMQTVFTRSGGNLRHGVYSHETRLTPAVVKDGNFRKLFTLKMPGDKVGMEAQPLFAAGVVMNNGQTRDLCVCCTMANQVYAFDANTGGNPLWKTTLGKPINGSKTIDEHVINDKWGILSTGVLDNDVLYCVAWISSDGSAVKGKHRLFRIRVKDGKILDNLMLSDAPKLQRKQRSALTLTNVNGKKTIFIPWGTIFETEDGAHGFITAVDVASFKVVNEWNASPKGKGAGIWMAGQGLCADDEGFLYGMTGNGTFDGDTDFSESFVKLRFDGTKISPIDWWSPWRDSDRGTTDGFNDMDLGAGGAIVIPEFGLVLGAGKDGILYVLDWRLMGQTKSADLNNPAANYAKLKSPPIWFTFYPGNKSATPNNPKELDFFFGGKTHHMHSTPVYWNRKLFVMGENSNVRAWTVEPSGVVKFLGRSDEVASPFAPVPPGGMPGGMLCLSSNGNEDGVLWACVPDSDANRNIVNGRVFAFDASDFSEKHGDGDNRLKRLWMSDPHYTYNKFNVPVVNGGKLYVPTYAATVDVFGV